MLVALLRIECEASATTSGVPCIVDCSEPMRDYNVIRDQSHLHPRRRPRSIVCESNLRRGIPRHHGQYRSPATIRGVEGPFLLTKVAEEARQRLATWASDHAVPSKDYFVDEQGDRTYKIESLKPLVEPLLREMNLAEWKYTMHRESDIRLIPVNHPTYAIPINVITGVPQIKDLASNVVTLLVGYFFTLSEDVLILPQADYLVVKRMR
ncbi:uncharacterized protein N7458_002592 [Penicillium daleae]|uniref:Uncharacterized protein n=1 Tax=Penicillium daleae TaxID=63821 RepID=A0AAD6CD45_9EURO|nr:uncharacterized protein N7458_002592 [Penicillium daleae]KAJ5461040.1 hypothetical protein N7458_002592 [Penicillium daleae]